MGAWLALQIGSGGQWRLGSWGQGRLELLAEPPLLLPLLPQLLLQPLARGPLLIASLGLLLKLGLIL